MAAVHQSATGSLATPQAPSGEVVPSAHIPPRKAALARPLPKAVALAVLVAAAAGLRAHRLAAPYITTDESFSWRVTQYATWEMLHRVGRDGHAPLHFLMLQAWTAAWGDSTAAMRSLSAVLGTAAVLMVYCLVYEALAHGPIPSRGPPEDGSNETATARGASLRRAARWGAGTAALVAAVHPLQIIASRGARMYGLGMLLAALSAWLVLRAMRAARPWRWWTACGAVAALFLYTHHFALFALLAQAVYVAAVAVGGLRQRGAYERRDRAKTHAAGLLLAVGVAFALYSPWLPVFHHQATEVLEAFWIPPQTTLQTTLTFTAWATGLDYVMPAALPVLLVLLAAGALAVARRGGPVGWFFLLQAGVPWVGCLAVSILGGRPLLQVRYLAFAQVGLFGLWGVLVASLPTRTERLALGAIVVVAAVLGLSDARHLYPKGEHAAVQAVRFLGEHHQPGDLVVVRGPAEVNRLRHTARQLGLRRLDVRCPFGGAAGPGHTGHVASLRPEEIIYTADEHPVTESRPRVWRVSERKDFAHGSPPGRTRVVERTFEGSEDSEVAIALFVRDEREPAP